jgi:L-alanine-DL-glutamate epimerase-like enolase superfamily enzyme
MPPARLELEWGRERWPLREPFRFAGYEITASELVTVSVRRGTLTGRGEAAGVIYRGETPDSICAQIETNAHEVEAGAGRRGLLELLPPGGARCALDCALWDLECKERGQTIWQLLGLQPKPLTTVVTIGLEPPPQAVERARRLRGWPLLKVKVDRCDPLGRLRAIRAVRPDARLVIDANQSWDLDTLAGCVTELRELGVEAIEQPLPPSEDEALESFTSPVPICADESCFVAAELPGLARRYDMVNIKLDKCGGLTEALDMVRRAPVYGLRLMVGNMIGTSLSMAPSFVIGQFCALVDLDGPLAMVADRRDGLAYHDGHVEPPRPELWG